MATVMPPPRPSEVSSLAQLPRRSWTRHGAAVGRSGQTLQWLTLGLILVGVASRLTRYFMQFPIWCDEAFVCVNFLDRDYLGLATRGLEHSQVAPVLFLWSQLAAFRLFGASELAMRLAPLLAGLASLGLFWRLAHITVKPLPAMLAVGLLAVSRWPVTMSAFAKPYSFDLLMALLLILPAVEWLRRPERLGWLALLALAAPVSLLGSYPAVFVVGAVALALLPAVWRAGWGGRVLFIAFTLLAAASFLGSCWIGRQQLDPVNGLVNAYLQEYWAQAFPPASPWPFVKWLVLIHAGRMTAYPFGDANGGSAVTLLLFLVGVWTWWKSGRRWLLTLWLTPFALNFAAAVIHRYPYGGCCRLSQHLAPAVCLLTGLGIAALLEKRVALEGVRLRWASVLCGVLALCAVGGVIADFVHPYHDPDALWLQGMARRIRAETRLDDQVVVAQDKPNVQPVFRWYMDTIYGNQVRWEGRIDEDRFDRLKGSLLVANFWVDWDGKNPNGPPSPQTPAAHGWTLDSQIPYKSRPRVEGDAVVHCDLYRWIPPKAE